MCLQLDISLLSPFSNICLIGAYSNLMRNIPEDNILLQM